MYTQNDLFSITDLRQKTTHVLKSAADRGVVYVLHRSNLKAAVVDPKYLRALQEAYEDYMDTLEFDRTINLPRIPLAKHKNRHRVK